MRERFIIRKGIKSAMPLTDAEVKNEIRSRWDISSQDYDTHDGHGIKSQEERNAWKKVLQEVLPGKNLDILDVGCGTGEMSLVLAELGHNVRGIDISEKMLAKARAKARASNLNMKFSYGDAEKPKFESGKFDAVVNRHLLWTLSDPKGAFSEWKRTLAKGGKIVVIDGEWRNGSFASQLKRLASSIGVAVFEGKNPKNSVYSQDLRSTLPHPFGLTPDRAMQYFEDCGLVDISCMDLVKIRELQRAKMPLHRRIAFSWAYYMVCGRKE